MSQGWEYATNFAGAVWKPENGVSSFVRRRRWKRHMRYTSLEKWAELSRSSEVIVELAVGGFNVLPEQECFLFALSKEGALLRRVGIHANNPDGDHWHEIDGELIDDDVKSESWNHKVRAKLRLAGERRFITGTIYLGVEQLIFQANTGVTIVKPLSEVTSAVREFDAGTSTFTIRTSFCDKSLELGFSEESDRDEWHESLEQEPFASIIYPPSLCIPGCMQSVSAGAEGVVWSVAKVVEYQRHAFMRGLPSRQWSWIDPEWTIVGAEKSESGWTYADVIDGVYKTEKKRKVLEYSVI
ncbi:Propeller [Ancylostoma ceylanicum]|uniref:Propeller n=1 Tax=Ancylostoma ceylanicum TaxID=53326 RepID=A0A0D6L4F0_9BILA|nr:Propeller [Ancylostoma ceylanicum]